MKRTTNVQRYASPPGSQEAHVAAAALANIANAETIATITNFVAAMHQFGGELTIGAYRFPFVGLRRVEPDTEGAMYDTAALLFHYQHVAKLTKVATDSPVEEDQGLDSYLPLVEEANDDSEHNPVDPTPEAFTPLPEEENGQPDIEALEDSALASAPAQVD